MRFELHALTAVPFLISGNYLTALGCIIPDISWVPNEILFRKSSIPKWHDWIKTLNTHLIIPYRLFHSVPLWITFCLYFDQAELLYGVLIHIFFDLFTHTGIMRQQPLYPLTWSWKWTLQKKTK